MKKAEMIKALKAKGIDVPKGAEVGFILGLYNTHIVGTAKTEEKPEATADVKTEEPKADVKTEEPKAEEKSPELVAAEKLVTEADPNNLELCDGFKAGQFCDAQNDACKACESDFPDAYAYCAAKAVIEASKTGVKKAARKAGAGSGTKVRGKFADFSALVKFLETSKSDGPVMALDKLLLEGGSYKSILDKIGALNKEKGWNHCKNTSSIKKHLKFRQDRGWVYEEKDGIVKLVDYKA